MSAKSRSDIKARSRASDSVIVREGLPREQKGERVAKVMARAAELLRTFFRARR